MSKTKQKDVMVIYRKDNDNIKQLETLKNRRLNNADDIGFMYDENSNIIKDNNPYLAISINTIKNHPIEPTYISEQKDKTNLLKFKEYLQRLKDRYNQDLSNTTEDELKDLIRTNNYDFISSYLALTQRCYNLLDEDAKNSYIMKLSDAITNLQVYQINHYLKDNKLNIEDFITKVDIKTAEVDLIIAEADLINIQVNVREKIKILDADNLDDKLDQIMFLLKEGIFTLTNDIQTKEINLNIKDNIKYYKTIQDYYKDTDTLIKQISKKYQTKLNELQTTETYTEGIKPTEGTKQYPLIATKLFNGNLIPLNKSTNINSINGDRHKDPINITISIDDKDLTDLSTLPTIIDLYKNDNKVALLPIDLPLWLSLEKLNILNGGNKPITLEDAFNDMVEDKNVRLRKTNKSYAIYQDRLLQLDKYKMVFSIVDAKTKKNIYTLKDSTSLLANSRVLLESTNKIAYLIGASSVLALVKAINKIYGIDFLASYNIDKEYLNDGQDNDIIILNMKYYIIPKILQYGNSKKRLDTAQNKINLDDLYTSTAILKGKKELSLKDRKTLKKQVDIYVNHLVSKGLINDYSYASDRTQTLSVDELKKVKQRDIKYLKVK
jgi:hypothetical protein